MRVWRDRALWVWMALVLGYIVFNVPIADGPIKVWLGINLCLILVAVVVRIAQTDPVADDPKALWYWRILYRLGIACP